MPRKPDKPSVVRRVEAAFAAACDAIAPLAPGNRLLLGCSAGGDSMALLHLMAGAAKARKWKLAAVHVDHRQRRESASEARRAAKEARALGLEVFVERIPDELAAVSPLSEEVMRKARHEIFRRVAADWEADALVLAHQADDRAETFLIRLLAGSGPTGLGAIRPEESVGGLAIARPLLAIRREELRAWLRWRGVEWREDPSNASLETKRGWLRHALLPAIEAHIGLDPTGRIVRAAELIDDEAHALAEAAAMLLDRLRRPAPDPAKDRIDLADLLWRESGPLLRRQLLRQWLWELRSGPHPPGFEAVAEALAFAESARPGAELRTIEKIYIVHLKTGLMAFGGETTKPERAAAAKGLIPAPARKKRGRINEK